MPHSDALAAHLRQRAERLDDLFDRIISCHIVVELDGHHHRHGDRFRFVLNVGLPGHELLVTHGPAADRDHETAYESADRAFNEAERQLKDWVRRQRDHRHQGGPRDNSDRS